MNLKPSTISSTQLAALLMAYSLGSAIVYIPNPLSQAAGNDAWLSLILAYVFGMIVLACTLYLYNKHDGASLIAYSRSLIGNALTIIVAIPLIGMLLFATSAINSGIGDFVTDVMMDRTPLYAFNSISMVIAGLTARAGISVTARMFVLLLFLLVVFSMSVLILAIPTYDPGHLMPMMEEGIRPLLHGVFISSGFPFGEVALFSMLLPFTNSKKVEKLPSKLYMAFSFTSLMLVLCTLCTTMAFGNASGYFKYSLYRLASEIQTPEIFQRVESIVSIALILGSYMKATLFLIILNQIIIQVFRIKEERALIYPLTLLCIFLSLTMFQSPADFEQQVYQIWPFTVLVVGCGFIFLYTLLTWLRSMKK
ncbi:GerAB/ArcD/ProY family transporter [Paenibacillus agricola]|uniref:Endospore germination permease n=1 Tax=Paenibacillus agricola TaxID=2716264 RepID=A0ABX0J3H1_9BACL|nr:endospore germination permease [Paenibacillus agricola]NHN30839.1 endospore germination permease [Paenibacillus agricola]